MAVVIALGIAVAVVAFVAAPFFLLTGRPSEETSKNPDTTSVALAELLAEKETIYAAIQELDFDLKSGKLSPEDHGALRRRHEAQAAAVLKRIDELQGGIQTSEKSRASRREKRKK
jgi:hypothetical protein